MFIGMPRLTKSTSLYFVYFFMLTYITADNSIGRFDISSLSDQTLMEMLVEGMGEYSQQDYKDENGDFKYVCEWGAYTCTDGRVTDVYFNHRTFHFEQFPFEYAPPLAKRISIQNGNLHGTLDTSTLPPKLVNFIVCRNKLHGPLNFQSFPRTLCHINIASNNFCGSCALADLPDGLGLFRANFNKFSGELALEKLPREICEIELRRNELSGSIRIEKFPPMTSSNLLIDLRTNHFVGDVVIIGEAAANIKIDLGQNPVSGTLFLPEKNYPFVASDSIPTFFNVNGSLHPINEELFE